MTFGDETIPAQTSFSVSVTDAAVAPEIRDKTFIASISGTRLSYNYTKRKGDVYSCYSRNPGKFRLANDTVAPKIIFNKSIEGKWLSKDNYLSCTISDNLSGIKSYNGYINGNWVLFDFDYKKRTITHDFRTDPFLVEGENQIKN